MYLWLIKINMTFIRILYMILGSVSLVVGIIGIFLPLLPTTPFLLLTAFFYMRSSQRCYNWLICQPVLGKYIVDYRKNKVIPLRAKIISLLLMWGSISYCLISLIHSWPIRILLVGVTIATSIHILSFKNRPQK